MNYLLRPLASLKKHTLPLVRLAVVCLLCFSVQAQDAAFHKVYFKLGEQITGNYTEVKENNLPIKGAQVLYQSSDQTVWVGTEGDGLISYTGNAIKHYRFDPKNTASLPSNRIDEIWEESSRILWITTNDGIAKLDRLSGRITRFEAKTRYVRKTPHGTLYTSVIGKGLYRINTTNHRLHSVQQPYVMNNKGAPYAGETLTIAKMETDKEGTLWAVGKTKTLEGLFHFNAKTGYWVFHAPASYYKQSSTEAVKIHQTANLAIMPAHTLFIDDDNRIWFGGWGSGLFCYSIKSGRWQQYSFYRNPVQTFDVDNNILNIYPLANDELWISSHYNGFVFNKQKGTAYDYTHLEGMGTAPPFVKQTAYALLDHCGNRWIADDNGVLKSNRASNRFSAADKGISNLMQGKAITAFYQLEPEHYLVAANGSESANARFGTEIFEIERGRIIRRIPINSSTSNTTVRQFITLSNGEFYVCGFLFHKLNRKKGSLQPIPIKIATEASETGLHVDSYNNFLWNDSILYSCRRTSAAAGLVKVNLKKREAQIYKTASTQLSPRFPQDNHVVRLMKDSYNRIWCGTMGGVDIFYPDKEIFEHYSPVEGDPTSLIGTRSPRVCEAPDHTFYIASQSGICATKAVPGTRATFTPIANLDCDWIIADKTNMLWAGTTQGVARINPITKTYKLFGIEDGFYWNALRIPQVMPDGRFMMHDGAIINPAAITQNTFKPVPRVSNFLVAGQPFPLDTAIEFKQHIRLKNDQNFFSIGYSCNSYINEEDNTYRYQLQGIDTGWVEAGSRTEAYYTALLHGTYQFYVQAANNDGLQGASKKLLTITIVPAWYQTWWFKISAALAVAAIIFAFFYLRIQQEKMKALATKREAELKQREAELKQMKAEFDKQLAETEMAALRAQMNPHFIFNVLNSINKYILSSDKKGASEYLVQFSRLIRLTLENSKSAKVPLQADMEALRIYINMEKLRFGDKFTCLIEVENDIDPQFVQIPPLLIQPYVENAIWHGLMQRDSPGHLLVQITQPDENILKAVVQDDGIGRARAQELKSKSATAHKSYGLQITSDRIKIVNKLHGIKTTVTVDDLYDEAQQPAGTKVTLLIPV